MLQRSPARRIGDGRRWPSSGGVSLLEVATPREAARFETKRLATIMAFSPDGTLPASGSQDGAARLWGRGRGRFPRGLIAAEGHGKPAFRRWEPGKPSFPRPHLVIRRQQRNSFPSAGCLPASGLTGESEEKARHLLGRFHVC